MVLYDLKKDLTFDKLKLCVIPVSIEGKKNKQIFYLLVDTGAEMTLLRDEVANIIGIEYEGIIKGQGITGQSKYKQGTVKNLEIGQKISLGSSRVVVGQLPGQFAKYNILGLLGATTMQEICLKIDYHGKYLEFSKVNLGG